MAVTASTPAVDLLEIARRLSACETLEDSKKFLTNQLVTILPQRHAALFLHEEAGMVLAAVGGPQSLTWQSQQELATLAPALRRRDRIAVASVDATDGDGRSGVAPTSITPSTHNRSPEPTYEPP